MTMAQLNLTLTKIITIIIVVLEVFVLKALRTSLLLDMI